MEQLTTVFPTPWVYIGCAAVLLLAQVVYVVFGFGSGLIAVGLMVHLLPELQDVVVLVLLVNLPAESWVLITGWRQVRWRSLAVIAVTVAVGIPIGTLGLRSLPGEPLLIGLGVVLVVVGVATALLPVDAKVNWPRGTAPVVGLTAGLLSGLFGTGGPPMIVYFQLSGVAKATFRTSLMGLFTMITLLRLPVYATAGLITPGRLLAALALLPVVILGVALGHAIQRRLGETEFRRGVSVAVALLGLALALRQVLS